MVYDGDCGFCRFWVHSWRSVVGDQVDFAPSHEVASQFPGIAPEKFAQSVQLILPDGQVFGGAEAVFRTLALAPGKKWMLWLYEHAPGFAPVSEACYRVIAAHRPVFSKLTGLLWGKQFQAPSYFLTRWIFLRLLGAIYFVAFLSFWTQVTGLIGAHGILPVRNLLEALAQQMGRERFRLFPTLAWLDSSDAFLRFLAGGGAFLSLLVVVGVLAGPLLALLWAFYLSLVTVGRDFMSFQWDILLLEAGFLAIFFAPWQLPSPPWRAKPPATADPTAPRACRGDSPPSTTVLWLLRWLLFRLAFLSGAVKLLSHDPTWRNLTALDYDYWSQPLPTPPAWYAAQLPAWFQKLSVAGVFVVELGVPFLIFAPRGVRFLAAGIMSLFQVLIGFTGNYCFFNLLTVALCVLLLDDAFWRRFLPGSIAERITASTEVRRPSRLGRLASAVLAVVIIIATSVRMVQAFGWSQHLPEAAREAVGWLAPFYIANSYGLFAVMTTSRLEIEVQGSQDGETWSTYEFKYKPGDVKRAPRWVEPLQPRLDWQMWFAALGSYQSNPWFVSFMVRLLQGSPEVTALLANNPFPTAPPRYVRALAYDYHFTDFATRKATGAWWRRELKGTYFPVVSLRGP